ncbi:MAG: hypothetical protein ACLFMX_04630 [Halobacteriales archaeon]
MQRRVAALYVGLFLVIAVGAIAFISAAEAPDPAMDEYDHQAGVDDTFEIDGVTYTVASAGDVSASIEWSVESLEQTGTWLNESEVESENSTYRVEIPDEEEPSGVVLQELFPEHDLETTEVNDTTYVIIEEDDEVELVPEDEYLLDTYGQRERLELEVGDAVEWDDVDTAVTVDEITPRNVQVQWTGPANLSQTLTHGATDQIGDSDREMVPNVVDGEYLQLTADVDAYEAHAERLATFDERHQGFWGVGVMSAIGAVLIGGLSFLPRRR